MKIELTNDKNKIVLSDDHLNSIGFLEVETLGEENYIHINELYPAVVAFKKKHDEELKRDKLLR
jgi:hypothetical protein